MSLLMSAPSMREGECKPPHCSALSSDPFPSLCPSLPPFLRAHVVVATPGRLLALLSQGDCLLASHVRALVCAALCAACPVFPQYSLLCSQQETLVLDEADRLLEMGFEQRSEVVHSSQSVWTCCVPCAVCPPSSATCPSNGEQWAIMLPLSSCTHFPVPPTGPVLGHTDCGCEAPC